MFPLFRTNGSTRCLRVFFSDPPSADALLMLQWIAQVSHPKLFDDYVIEEVIRDYYARFYDFNLRDEDIAAILKPTH